MLYDVRKESVLKDGYQVKYVSIRQPGQETKYVPIYRSPSGDEVYEKEATVENSVIVELPDVTPTRSAREQSIAKLIRILDTEHLSSIERNQFKHAIDVMSPEPELKLRIGKEWAAGLPPENPDEEYAVSLLAQSGLKEAIAPLTNLLVYEASHDHYTCCEDPVHDLARKTLREFVAGNSEFRYVAACEAIELHDQSTNDFRRDELLSWAVELLAGLAYDTNVHDKWARNMFKKLVGAELPVRKK